MAPALPSVWLVRHGATDWSLAHRHTGRTDRPLTADGEREAASIGRRLAGVAFARVLTSPRQRARLTCERAGLGADAEPLEDLAEWDYGAFEGLTTAGIHAAHPGWELFRDGCPGGESPAQVAARADRVIARLRAAGGRSALFSHGHFLCALAARWLGLAVEEGHHLTLGTASLSILDLDGDHDDTPVLTLWNEVCGGAIAVARGER